MPQKRAVAIHDISCLGKCSLTCALPILSAAGHECCVIPTAVLSTHTGGFSGYTFRDLSDDILPIVAHWERQGIRADLLYSGYLGSIRQCESVAEAVRRIRKESSLFVCDPAMADNGRLYAGFSAEFVPAMLGLCRQADILVPNLTEACLLTGQDYPGQRVPNAFCEALVKQLYEQTGASIVLTGAGETDETVGAAVYDGTRMTLCLSRRIPAVFHGTGDVFASALCAALLSGNVLTAAADFAAEFTVRSIEKTLRDTPDRRYGVHFETQLGFLAQTLNPDP